MAWKKKKDYTKNPIDLSSIDVPMKIDRQDLDAWQTEVIEHEGNIAICSGRQVGKSAVMALKAVKTALKYPGIKILISSGSERQAHYIYEKIRILFNSLKIDPCAETPTQRLTRLKNGTEIYCLPTGDTGDLIRGLTLDIWIPDEAAYIRDAVYATVSPMLWVSKNKGMGWIWALSTPAGKAGKFYELFKSPDFKTWRVSAENCKRIPKAELESWKNNYSRVQYAQEVLGEFVDEIARFFPDEVIDKCINAPSNIQVNGKFLGVDVARYGGDENAFVSCATDGEKYIIYGAETTERKGIHETFAKVVEMDQKERFNKILIDDAGVGGGLTDFLIEKMRGRVIGINNASRAVEAKNAKGHAKRKMTMKHDIYSTAAMLMEQGAVSIGNFPDLIQSLRSMLYEYSEESGKLKIYGRDSHLAEAFVRALYGAKGKGLNLWCTFTGDGSFR